MVISPPVITNAFGEYFLHVQWCKQITTNIGALEEREDTVCRVGGAVPVSQTAQDTFAGDAKTHISMHSILDCNRIIRFCKRFADSQIGNARNQILINLYKL